MEQAEGHAARNLHRVLGPSEVHAITYVAMARDGSDLTPRDTQKLLDGLQDPNDPGWPNISVGSIKGYTTSRFVPAGLVELDTQTRGSRDVEVARALYDEAAIAEAQVLLRWSHSQTPLEFDEPELSLRDVVGEGKYDAPFDRLGVVTQIYNEPGITLGEATAAVEGSNSGVRRIVDDLALNGVVEKRPQQDWAKQIFEIDPGFKVRGSSNDATRRPETDAIYDVIERRALDGDRRVSAARLLEETISRAPGVDPAAIRLKIRDALISSAAAEQRETTVIPPLLLVESTPGDGRLSEHYINPGYDRQVGRLIRGLDALAVEVDDGEDLGLRVQRAYRMLDSRTQVSDLFRKAHDQSPAGQALSQGEFLEAVDSMVVENGPQSARMIANRLTSIGHETTVTSVQRRVQRLGASGLFEIENLREDSEHAREVRHVVSVVRNHED